MTSKPGAMKTLPDALWFFPETHGYELWDVSTKSNGLHVVSKGRQFMRNTKLLMAKITLKDHRLPMVVNISDIP